MKYNIILFCTAFFAFGEITSLLAMEDKIQSHFLQLQSLPSEIISSGIIASLIIAPSCEFSKKNCIWLINFGSTCKQFHQEVFNRKTWKNVCLPLFARCSEAPGIGIVPEIAYALPRHFWIIEHPITQALTQYMQRILSIDTNNRAIKKEALLEFFPKTQMFFDSPIYKKIPLNLIKELQLLAVVGALSTSQKAFLFFWSQVIIAQHAKKRACILDNIRAQSVLNCMLEQGLEIESSNYSTPLLDSIIRKETETLIQTIDNRHKSKNKKKVKKREHLGKTNTFVENVLTKALKIGNLDAVTTLLQSDKISQKKKKALVNTKDILGKRALSIAVACTENKELLKRISDLTIDINSRCNNGTTALHSAIAARNRTAIKLLLKKGALATIKDTRDVTPLMYAASYPCHNTEILETIYRKEPKLLHEISKVKKSALSYAITQGWIKGAQQLISWGCFPRQQDLTYAIYSDNEELVRLILNNKLPKPSYSPLALQHTPLEAACANNKIETVRQILTNNYYSGQSELNAAFFEAATAGSQEIIKLLLNHGANPSKTNHDGTMAWEIAEKSGHQELAKFLKYTSIKKEKTDIQTQLSIPQLVQAIKKEKLDTIRQLLSYRPQLINSRYGIYNQTPLHIAARNGSLKIVQFLLNNNGDPCALCLDNETDETITPLESSVPSKKIGVFTLLLKQFHDTEHNFANTLSRAIDAQFFKAIKLLIGQKKVPLNTLHNSKSFLTRACAVGSEKIIRYLLAQGAKPDLEEETDQKPIIVAASNPSHGESIVNILLEAGASPLSFDFSARILCLYPSLYQRVLRPTNLKKILLKYAQCWQSDAEQYKLTTELITCMTEGNRVRAIEIMKHKNFDPCRFVARPYSRHISLNPVLHAAEHGLDEFIPILFMRGATTTLCSRERFHALNIAACRGHLKIVKQLLKFGFGIDDKIGSLSALFCAAACNQIEIVKFLLKKGARADLYEIFVAAIENGNSIIFETLLSAEAMQTISSEQIKNLIDVAQKNNQPEFFRLLNEYLESKEGKILT